MGLNLQPNSVIFTVRMLIIPGEDVIAPKVVFYKIYFFLKLLYGWVYGAEFVNQSQPCLKDVERGLSWSLESDGRSVVLALLAQDGAASSFLASTLWRSDRCHSLLGYAIRCSAASYCSCLGKKTKKKRERKRRQFITCMVSGLTRKKRRNVNFICPACTNFSSISSVTPDTCDMQAFTIMPMICRSHAYWSVCLEPEMKKSKYIHSAWIAVTYSHDIVKEPSSAQLTLCANVRWPHDPQGPGMLCYDSARKSNRITRIRVWDLGKAENSGKNSKASEGRVLIQRRGISFNYSL